MTPATRPLDRDRALSIARAFLPRRWYGNRYDYYYVQSKLRTDPLYPGVLAALRGSTAPVLDLGCGLGLLAHALHGDGQRIGYRGVDIDTAKILRARRAADVAGLDDATFDVVDLAQGQPTHAGSVAILDVLQYLSLDAQRALLADCIAMLVPGARLVLRAALDDPGRRGRTTRITDRLAHAVGWMQAIPKAYPDGDAMRAQFDAAGLQSTFEPLYGNTPFNHWLIVAARPA